MTLIWLKKARSYDESVGNNNRQASSDLSVREVATIFQAQNFLKFSHRYRCRRHGSTLLKKTEVTD